jgi:hypothetical protein
MYFFTWPSKLDDTPCCAAKNADMKLVKPGSWKPGQVGIKPGSHEVDLRSHAELEHSTEQKRELPKMRNEFEGRLKKRIADAT